MTDGKISDTSSSRSPYGDHEGIGFEYNLNLNYNTARLSKVTEENSNHNNSSKDQDDEYEQELEYEQDMDGEAIASAAAPAEWTDGNVSSLTLHPVSSLTAHQQFYQHLRHNNTPQTTDDDQRFNTPYSSPPNEMIPDRVRFLLDRFAANGYILSNAPPPLSKTVIELLPEMTVDKKFVDSHSRTDEHDMECPICKIQMETQQSIKVLPCTHYFHSRCITTWLNIHASCPLCRRRIDVHHASSSGNAPSQPQPNVQISDAMITEDAQTRSQMNRLQELRRRRRSRRTLRSSNHSNSASGSHTPHSNRRHHSNGNTSSGNIQHAATQLINAVCEVLDQYAVQPQQPQQSPFVDDNDQKMVRFNTVENVDNPGSPGAATGQMYMRRKMRRMVSSPGPPPPHSSRSNTQVSSPGLSFQSEDAFSPLAIHQKHYSSPVPKTSVAPTQQNEEQKQNIQVGLCSPKTTSLRQRSNSDEEQKLASLESNAMADKEEENASPNEPISAARIRQDFAKFMRRRSRLDSNSNSRPMARQTSTRTDDTDDMKQVGDNGMHSASTSRTNSFHHCANESNVNGRRTIIYNSNQNFIYNNNYNNAGGDDSGGNMQASTAFTTPSPSTHATKNVADNFAGFALSPRSPFSGPNSPYMPLAPLQLPRKSTVNTMIVKDDEYGEDGEDDDEHEMFCDGDGDGDGNGVFDNVVDPLSATDLEQTPTPLHSAPNTNTNTDIYAMMSDEQLNVAANRHRSIVSKHQYIIEQIELEKNRRVLNSCWNCPECLKNPRAFLFLPCRHLGLCTKCNSVKLNKIMRCVTCNASIQQKIPINFAAPNN